MSEQNKLVVVTGANGFLGSCVKGTVRSTSNPRKVGHLQAWSQRYPGKLELVEAQLDADEGWANAMEGASAVLHVASPFPSEEPADEMELIRPAREGTLRVLRAAAAAGSVTRVVVTSSAAAVAYGHDADRYSESAPAFTEEDWSVVETSKAYYKSKTLAERAAWDFAQGEENTSGFSLATVNPTFLLGPPLSAQAATSVDIARRLLTKDMPGCPALSLGVVDVRDVALAHVRAMERQEAADQRFLCSSSTVWMSRMGQGLASEFSPMGYQPATRQLPNWLIRVASWCDPSLRLIMPDLGRWTNFDSSKAQRELDVTFRALDESLADMGHALILHGIVPRKSGYRPKREIQELVDAGKEEGSSQ